jgi:hypothetical protein
VSLDVMAVAGQVRQMGREIANTQSDFIDRVRWARGMLESHSQAFAMVAGNVRDSRAPRKSRAAVPKEPLSARRTAPPCPPSYVAAACDGSQAEPDRHGHVSYCLINTGTALIRYGADAFASFHTHPRFYYRHEDLFVLEERQDTWPEDQEPREAQVDGDILAMKRSVVEIKDLARLAQNVPADIPSILMIDGTLPLFARTTGDNAWVGEQLVEEYREGLDSIAALRLPVVGFVSRSNATWVIDMLQVGVCERKVGACSFCRHRIEPSSACALVGLRDRFLYDNTISEPGTLAPLMPGERSALFQMSSTLYQDYRNNEPLMFYLNTGREIAQVQVPKWVAGDKTLLDQVHALVYAQCQNGGGYPTVLMRAHEQAIVTVADRDTIDQLVLSQLIGLGISLPVSEKARSKQVRGI